MKIYNTYIHILFLILLVSLAGCDGFEQTEAENIVKKVGAERIRQAVEKLRGLGIGEVPDSEWPEAIRELTPIKIYIDENGASISKRKQFVQEEGIFVVFSDAKSPNEKSQDPYFRKIDDRIYWYLFTG